MTKSPLINGVAATLYITAIASLLHFGMKFMPDTPDTVLAPIAMISLFTLSAAVMGYIFCFQPAQLYLDGKKKQAGELFLQTTAVFGCITLIILIVAFSGILP